MNQLPASFAHGCCLVSAEQGFSAAKQVRAETGIGRNAVSVAFAAVELARKIFGELGGRSVLVVGAGKMAALATRHLVGTGIDRGRLIYQDSRLPDRIIDIVARQAAELRVMTVAGTVSNELPGALVHPVIRK